MRPDVLAYNAYSDPFLDWEIWIGNKILDPYYGWHLNENEFKWHIIDKYGSLVLAEQSIAYYRLNWPTEDEQVPVAYYENHMPGIWKKYFKPVWGQQDILYYTKALEEWKMQTNKIVQFTVTMDNANTVYPANTIIQTLSGPDIVGQATTIQSNSSVILAQHVSGDISSPCSIQSFTNANLTAVSSNTMILQTNIDDDEAVFWEPAYYYDIEQEENAKKRFINLVDPTAVLKISTQITRELNS